MKNVKMFICSAIIGVALFSGCASWVVPSQKVVLLPEERIFTIPAGLMIDVLLDKKKISMTFPYDMKLVSPAILVRQEQKLNDVTFKKIKAEKKNSNIMAVLIAIFGTFSGIIGVWVKNKATSPKK